MKAALKKSVLTCSSSTIFQDRGRGLVEGWAAGVEEDFI